MPGSLYNDQRSIFNLNDEQSDDASEWCPHATRQGGSGSIDVMVHQMV